MEEGPARKRLRRHTRSCYPCRRRKVKCQLTVDDHVSVCAECVKTGSQCTMQQPPETDLAGNSDVVSPAQATNPELESRLKNIESLLQRLVENQEQTQSRHGENSSSSDPTSTSSIPAASSIWNDVWLPSPDDGFQFPLSSDFQLPQPPDAVDVNNLSDMLSDTNKQALAALLPSTQDATTIVTNTTAWLWGLETPLGNAMTPKATLQLLQNVETLNGSAMHIAKTLLLFALYMQQLPASYDDVKFFGYKGIESAISMITDKVRLFLLSHEDEELPVVGLEALVLLSLIYLNDCSIRKAWIMFRRALDVARLKGFQNSYSESERNSTSDELALHRSLWLSSVCGDYSCSLLLGLEPGTGRLPYGINDLDAWNDPFTDEDADTQRRISLIVGSIARRNAEGASRNLEKLEEIDEALDKFHDSLPHSWWKTPMLRQDRPLESAKEPSRIVCQLWFFQSRMYAHMPIAFGQDFNDISQHSLEICMEAARNTLQRHTGWQHARDYLSRCRAVDQAVVVAALVLLLAKAQLRSHQKSRTRSTRIYHDADLALLEQVAESFDSVGRTCRREHLMRQGAQILSSMMEIADTEEPEGGKSSSISGSNPDVAVFGDGLGKPRSGIEDIIVSSILPSLDTQGPAYAIVKTWLEITIRVREEIPEPSQRRTDITLDDFIDSNLFL